MEILIIERNASKDLSLMDSQTADEDGNREKVVPPPDANEESATLTATRCVLEDFMQCSKSHLWKLMMSFYDRKGNTHRCLYRHILKEKRAT